MRQSPLRAQVNTYSRWLPAFYVLLVLAPLHVMVNVAVFAAFLRIDVVRLRTTAASDLREREGGAKPPR